MCVLQIGKWRLTRDPTLEVLARLVLKLRPSIGSATIQSAVPVQISIVHLSIIELGHCVTRQAIVGSTSVMNGSPLLLRAEGGLPLNSVLGLAEVGLRGRQSLGCSAASRGSSDTTPLPLLLLSRGNSSGFLRLEFAQPTSQSPIRPKKNEFNFIT